MRTIKLLVVLAAAGLSACDTEAAKEDAPTTKPAEHSFLLDSDRMIGLDAESLGEQGVGDAYRRLAPMFVRLGIEPEPIEEITDPDIPSYAVSHRGKVYPVYTPDLDKSNWGLGTFALFAIVNSQLEASTTRFYAVNGGNELAGIFMTEEEFTDAKASLANKIDWPYIPSDEHPWYGQQY